MMGTAMDDLLAKAALSPDQVVVQRVRLHRVVDSPPPVRCEGDITILPVTAMRRRRVVVKEEIHFRRVQTMARPD